MRVSDVSNEKHMKEEDAIRSAKLITSILDEIGIEYWFDYGALLGTIRGQAFIPWDTDIEINFKYANDGSLKLLQKLLEKNGFKFEMKEFYVHIKERNGYVGMSISWFPTNTRRKFLSYICYHLPTFIRKGIIKGVQEIYCKSTNEYIRPDDGEDRERSWHCRAIRQMLPIFFCGRVRRAKLYDFEVNVPGKAEELLLLRYGEEWKVPMKRYRSYTT